MVLPRGWLRGVTPLIVSLAACNSDVSPTTNDKEAPPMANPVRYFEIPVSDLDRAVRFYTSVFGHDFERSQIDGYEMALFPLAEGAPGASGALVKGDVYVPSKTGAIIYFTVPDIDDVLRRAAENGGSVLYPKKSVGEFGHVAEIEDSEGNRIALQSSTD